MFIAHVSNVFYFPRYLNYFALQQNVSVLNHCSRFSIVMFTEIMKVPFANLQEAQ